MVKTIRMAALLLLLNPVWAGGARAQLTEQEFFEDLPEVLTVTRLAQPVGETPGAVTIIDRETIRKSGAREVTDVLRLVPGYFIGGINGAHASAAYHAPLDDYGSRNLVFVDGRSVYNSYYLGETFRGLMGVLVEDIERIEILRGSNSAAYGANAMFGVINIVTRNAADTHGAEIGLNQGGGGIQDKMARVGWGDDVASYRLSAGRRQDSGWGGAHDDRREDQFHFRGDIRPAPDQDLMLTAGRLDMDLDDGVAANKGNPFRTTTWRESFFNLQWRKQLSGTDTIKLSANHDEATNHDQSVYAPDPSVMLDFGGHSRKTSLEFQHQVGLTPELRAVWGLGYERNGAKSAPLFYRSDWIYMQESRLFGNVEWRPHAQWVLNAGGFWNRHDRTGLDFSPRLMANFLITPDHSLRFGSARALRTPNLFEMSADVRYFPKDFARLLAAGERGPALAAFLKIPYRLVYGNEQLEPERLKTTELGYFGNFRELRMTLDVRAYVETMTRYIQDTETTIPGYVIPAVPPNPFVPAGTPIPVGSLMNSPGFRTHGIEYQLRWKPLAETVIWLNQAFQKLEWDDDAKADDINRPPLHATTLALFQKLPYNLDLSLMLHSYGVMTWGNESDDLPHRRRIDARLAWPFRIGSTRVEAAVTAQAMNGNYPDYLLRRGYEFERRAFGSLRFEF